MDSPEWLLTVTRVMDDVIEERERQDTLYGTDPQYLDGTGDEFQRSEVEVAKQVCQDAADAGELRWADVLYEEVAEALAESDPAKLRAELIHVAAVAARWVQAIDARVVKRG